MISRNRDDSARVSAATIGAVAAEALSLVLMMTASIKCSRRPAASVVRPARFLFAPREKGLYIAGIVSRAKVEAQGPIFAITGPAMTLAIRNLSVLVKISDPNRVQLVVVPQMSKASRSR